MQFPHFTPTGQPAGDKWLADVAAVLAPMSPTSRALWLAGKIEQLRDWPERAEVNAFTKSAILLTLDGWLEQSLEARAA